MKRKALREGALTNNQTPAESLPERENKETFTDVDAARAQERARIADREEMEGKK